MHNKATLRHAKVTEKHESMDEQIYLLIGIASLQSIYIQRLYPSRRNLLDTRLGFLAEMEDQGSTVQIHKQISVSMF